MSVAAPMSYDPLNRRLSKLPFMEADAGAQLCEQLRWMLDQPDAQTTDGHAILLHLSANHGPVLLEMVANLVTQPSSRLVIMTGREVNSNLVSLIAESVAGTSEELSEADTDAAYQCSEINDTGSGDSEGDSDDKAASAVAVADEIATEQGDCKSESSAI